MVLSLNQLLCAAVLALVSTALIVAAAPINTLDADFGESPKPCTKNKSGGGTLVAADGIMCKLNDTTHKSIVSSCCCALSHTPQCLPPDTPTPLFFLLLFFSSCFSFLFFFFFLMRL